MRIIGIIMATLISFMSSGICFADSNNTVKTYKFDDNIKMNGVISSNEKFFSVGSNWNVKKAKLNLVFTKSELLDVDYSTITILVNDTPVESQKLDGKKKYKKETVVDIPTDLLKTGYNDVTIKAYKTISDKVCKDDSNTANWLVLHKESNINIEYSYKKNSNLISDYKNTFINIDNGVQLNTTLLVSDKYSSSELSAAMTVAADFGKKLKLEDFKFDLKTYSDFKNTDDNVVFIGNEENTPKKILNVLTKKEKSNLDKGCVIKQDTSPFNKNKNILLLISNNDKLLKNASKLVTSDKLIENLNSNSLTVYDNTDINDLIKKEDSNKIYLKDLGYENVFVKGPFSQEVIMDINTSKSHLVTSNSKLNFKMRYADNLDFDRSLVTIYVNDTPIGSKKLTKENSNNDFIELNLPKEILNKNYYQIKVVFNLELLDVACVTRDTDNPWAYISNESYIDFDYKENNDLSFRSYPFPLVKDEQFNDLTVVVPNNVVPKDLNNLAGIISYLGRDVDYNNGDINIIKESEVKNSDKNKNLIVIGTPTNNSLVKDLNSNLNIKFNSDYNGFESNDKIKFVGDFSSTLTSVQFIKSPYNKEKSVLVIAGVNNSLSLCNTYLNDLTITKNLTGDTLLLGSNGYMKDLSFNTKEEAHEEVKEDKNLNKQSKTFIIVAFFLFLGIIASIILVIRKYKLM
ncbi:MAG TPA: cell wall anchor protein [Terrisporobacter glycolicus]|uniref:cellulose biosynthesis cyclic di-GMP-binding regulatory protein BcsB n=1 Tax=Terrisporobacter TaxID=1505652 RepID=UPI000E895DF1|nr:MULTISPECIES: cellulose biosynthesis cyclic di-GMP-binding regulatory protein BcsB [Terrisporobacter]HBI92073.1 cell wall anchor protein [Terrisporobacter hibernicus]